MVRALFDTLSEDESLFGQVFVFGVFRAGWSVRSGASPLNFEEGKMMKDAEIMKSRRSGAKGFVVRLFAFAFVFYALVFFLGGCGGLAHLGETKAEASRRHRRSLAINQKEMMADIDKVLLLDRPSKLTEKRIP